MCLVRGRLIRSSCCLLFFPSHLLLVVVRKRVLGFDFRSDALQPFLSPLGNLEIRIFYQNVYRSVHSFHFFFIFLFLRIHLVPGFIDSEQADWMFEQLLQDIPWGQRTHIRQGKGCVDQLFRSFRGHFHTKIHALFIIVFNFTYYHPFTYFLPGFPCISEEYCCLFFNLYHHVPIAN